MSKPSSIITAKRTSSNRRDMSSLSAVRVLAMNMSDTAVFDVNEAARSTSSPTGSPTRANLRVETPASIRSITARVKQVAVGEVLIRRDRQLTLVVGRADPAGRRTGTRRPPSVIEPSSWP